MVHQQVTTHFGQKSMSVPKDLESILLLEVPCTLASLYSIDVNFENAKVQLQMLPVIVKAYRESQALTRLGGFE